MSNQSIDNLRNIAIIAHVDHGKTTLVDKLLQQSGTLEGRGEAEERVMDSNDIEKERGITILAKNTAINWNDYRINIVDTPGHADFGGEVERIMSMVDSVLLIVDAVDGPMPQTRFVTQKAFAYGLKPIVVINKIDRPGARPEWVMDQIFDLFDNLGATDEQLDFVAAPFVDVDGPLQMQISQLDYSSYVGVIGVARITRGTVTPNQQVTIVGADGTKRNGKVGTVLGYLGLERHEVTEAKAGDIVAITGLGELKISDTICDVNTVEALVPLSVDEPTVTMTFQVNTSPFAGKEGKYVTSREGYELAVSRPEVIIKEEDGKLMEPFEIVTIDVIEEHQGSVMEKIGIRKGELKDMAPDGKGRVRMDFMMPSRGLIGFQTEFLTMTSGSGLIYHTFDHYGPHKGGTIGQRANGVLISNGTGKAVTYSLFNLQERGRLFAEHGDEVYEGQIIGMHNRANDLTINCLRGKQLTNVRASGTDEAQTLSPAVKYTLEQALEFIDDDELVEVTPESIRIRKKLLTENDRKRSGRGGK
jgi:GTP-binding protein